MIKAREKMRTTLQRSYFRTLFISSHLFFIGYYTCLDCLDQKKNNAVGNETIENVYALSWMRHIRGAHAIHISFIICSQFPLMVHTHTANDLYAKWNEIGKKKNKTPSQSISGWVTSQCWFCTTRCMAHVQRECPKPRFVAHAKQIISRLF